mgnify:CR=1 FL=1
MAKSQKYGSRILGGIILVLIVLFVVIDYFIRQSTEFSPANASSTAALPMAYACSTSVFDAMWRAERCR